MTALFQPGEWNEEIAVGSDYGVGINDYSTLTERGRMHATTA
jgi:hypothetical protein